jgi:hypothetical protein
LLYSSRIDTLSHSSLRAIVSQKAGMVMTPSMMRRDQ